MALEMKNAHTIKTLLQISLRNVEDEKIKTTSSLRKSVLSLNMANEILCTLDKVIAKTDKKYIPKKRIPAQVNSVYSLPYPKQKRMRGKVYTRRITVCKEMAVEEPESKKGEEAPRKTFKLSMKSKVAPLKNDYFLDRNVVNQKSKLQAIIYKLSNLFK
ncbi:hypothetical protein HDV06_005409 [Boothiomyces sp. JEL0866]|nr:hypothetical protein HDV06_005409 [Boothiomyces sp. JEL0866]